MSEAAIGGRRGPDPIPSLTATGVFDPLWYRDTYADVADWSGTLEAHFKARGAWLGYRPNRFFDTPHYLAQHPDLERLGVDPLTHYLERGEREGATPNPDFDPVWYALTYPSHRSNHWGPFAHHCAFGWHLRLSTRRGQVDEREQVASEIRADGLFDPALYRLLNPDVAEQGIDPLRHYVDCGAREGRQPHPLFDIGYYLDQVPTRGAGEENVIWHYGRVGSSQDLDPNTWFENAWYRARYGGLMRPSETPLAHFIRVGGYRTNPSPYFDAIRYRKAYPAIARGLDPLSDFMVDGMDLGRPAHPVPGEEDARRDASDAILTCLKRRASPGRRTALLVTFAARGRIKGHVPPHAEALRRQGIDVVLIVAAPEPTTLIPETLMATCASVYLRENVGFDFAAWAQVILLDPELLASDVLYLTNDSIVGPFDDDALRAMLDAIDRADEPVIGLTDNRFYAWHLQSFFLAIKAPCLQSQAFQTFWSDVVIRTSKDAVIRAYELTFTGRLTAAGFAARALFPMSSRRAFEGNRSVLNWQELLESGFPFVKASLVIGEHKETAAASVFAVLQQHGFDTARFEPDYDHGASIHASHT